MARGASEGWRPHRLRPVADDHRRGPPLRRGLPRGRRRACAGGGQSHRPHLDRSSGAAARPVSLHPVALAGEAAAAKIARLQAALAEKKVDAAVLTQADSIAWTFNIRGSDIAHNPVPLGLRDPPDDRQAVPLHRRPEALEQRPHHPRRARRHPRTGRVRRRVWPPSPSPKAQGASRSADRAPQRSSARSASRAARSSRAAIPSVLPKARKNPTELAGAGRAHLRDGAAMVRFLAWLDRTAPPGGIDEIAAADSSLISAPTARAATAPNWSSFPSTRSPAPDRTAPSSTTAPRPEPTAGSRPERSTSSIPAAQYRDGTTDITRTVAIGTPTDEMRDRFTRVLKGHIAIATARFPAGTTGAQLDALARIALWQAGLDYDHGTGHGVGVLPLGPRGAGAHLQARHACRSSRA